MDNQFMRTISLVGEDAFNKLKNCNVLVVGAGGVGGYAIEALIRCGINNISVVDYDEIAISNLNRQILATQESIGKKKVYVAKARALAINAEVNFTPIDLMVSESNVLTLGVEKYDYVVDCIDTVTAKVAIIKECYNKNVKVISCLGTGNKLNDDLLEITDINKTSYCPLAKAVRKLLKENGVDKLNVLYSKEQPIKNLEIIDETVAGSKKRKVISSISYLPAIAGLKLAGFVIRELIK